MAGGGDLKLLGMWASPFVLRVKLALSLKGLSYEYVEEDLFGGKSELLLKSNPVHNKVPVLIHNGKPVCESLIILQYIDEAFAGTGPSLLPADPYERAVARFWAAYIDDKMLAAWMQASRGTEEDKAEGKKQWSVAVETLEGALRDCGKGKPFFGGDSVGYVDVVLGGLLGWMHANEEAFGIGSLDPQRTPLLVAWSKRFGALETVEPVMPDVSRLVELGKMVLAREAAAAAAPPPPCLLPSIRVLPCSTKPYLPSSSLATAAAHLDGSTRSTGVVSSLSVRQWTRTRLTDEKKDVFLLGGYIFSGLSDELKQQIIIVASGRQDIAERATKFSILGLYNTVYFAGGQFCTTSKLRVLNDLLDGTHFLASIEAMYLGVRPGIHPSIVYGIISNAAGRTFVELVPKLPSGDPLLIDFLNSATKNALG